MTERIDRKRIAIAIEQLEHAVPARKLTVLRHLILHNGGRWDLPSEKPGVYDPLIKSVELFGVYGMAEEAEELSKNWLKAAHNILIADEAVHAAEIPTGPPELCATVTFQRSTTHHPETGIVRGRQFSTGIVEVEDKNAEQVRLTPDQYEPVAHANT